MVTCAAVEAASDAAAASAAGKYSPGPMLVYNTIFNYMEDGNLFWML